LLKMEAMSESEAVAGDAVAGIEITFAEVASSTCFANRDSAKKRLANS
jgi:hypothetical protein